MSSIPELMALHGLIDAEQYLAMVERDCRPKLVTRVPRLTSAAHSPKERKRIWNQRAFAKRKARMAG